jgi:hypothetical protein
MVPAWDLSTDNRATREDGVVVYLKGRGKWRAEHPKHGTERTANGAPRVWQSIGAAIAAMDERYPPDRITAARGMPVVILTATQVLAVREQLTGTPEDPAVLGHQVWLGGAARGTIAKLAQQLEATDSVAAWRAARRLREAIPAMPSRHDRRNGLEHPPQAEQDPDPDVTPARPTRAPQRPHGPKEGSLRDQILDWISEQESEGNKPTAGDAARAFDLPVGRYFQILHGGPLDHHRR